ncbi:C40 family peptidase [Vibrio paucivorans]|uniref:NlpC/P60 family protein n=1 Tax=Vibrio paucivorans TaxID=2829489 RepID=A0A9X3CC00_9VIBR|nr:NlpC/P60 family protein [Vibrio paucivorans]MCW8332959.1 NlpC/P60 family protein [Vibrio paucivorans]
MDKIAVLVLGLLITGCSTAPSTVVTGSKSAVESQPTSLQQRKLVESFLTVFDQWEGAPYQLGGSSLAGIDCSAFVQIAYSSATQQKLPRTTLKQSQVGTYVNYDQAEIGDLVFFKTSRTTRHVGVYLGSKQFMHASTSKGVIISRIDNPYWASKFWQFRRVANSPEKI